MTKGEGVKNLEKVMTSFLHQTCEKQILHIYLNFVLELDTFLCLSTTVTSGVCFSKIFFKAFVGQFSCPPNTKIVLDRSKSNNRSDMLDISESTELSKRENVQIIGELFLSFGLTKNMAF